MQLTCALVLSLLSVVTSQEQNLTSLLSSHENLSSLNSLVTSNPAVAQALSSAKNVTVLAPSNAAIEKLLSESGSSTLEAQFSDPDFARALLQYHVLNGEYAEHNIPETSMFIPTLLTDDSYVNITGGQVVQAIRTWNAATDGNSNGSAKQTVFYSGYNKNSSVVDPVRIVYLDKYIEFHA
jgi:uncharacterized surface protein with fasciclin (FAS1) repeats